MTDEQIIQAAIFAGFRGEYEWYKHCIPRFRKLLEIATQSEQDRCLRIVESYGDPGEHLREVTSEIAQRIRGEI